MPFEYQMLAVMGLLFLFAFLPSSFAKVSTYGFKWAGSSRDKTPDRPLPAWGGRVERAHVNLKDNLPAFIIAVLVLGQMNGFNETTKWLSGLYVAGRILHFLAYAIANSPLRTVGYFTGVICNAWLLIRIINP